jgi:N,N-dimethylformamidase
MPEGFKSDAYALILTAGDASENIPFFVVPPRARPRAKIAVLVSTYTYTVYGNHARPEWMLDPQWRDAHVAQTKAWNAYPYNPGAHRDYGLSTYNYHSDGSGIALVTGGARCSTCASATSPILTRTSAARACATTRPTAIC